MTPVNTRTGGRPRRPWKRPARPAAAVCVLVAGLLGACSEDPPALRVDGVAFTEDELLGISGDRRDRLVTLTALGLAYARGEEAEAGAPLLERRREDLLLDRFRAALALERAGVQEDVLRAQYRTNPRYELVVRHVVALADENAPDSVQRAARATAETALERVGAGEPFAEVAAELSEEPGAAERGGRLQPGREGSWVPGFWTAAVSLEEGAHTGVVRTEYGYHVIRLEERRVVPFEEVRGRAVREAGAMLGGAEDAWSAWTDSVSAELEVDRQAVARWAEAAGAPGFTTAGDGDAPEGGGGDGGAPLPTDSVALARWDGGTYTVRDFRSHVASLELSEWRRVVGATPERVADEVRTHALRARAAREATDRDLGLSDARIEELRREWSQQVAAWALPLGFETEPSAAGVKERALAALASSRQNATIARREVDVRAPLLRAAYPVHEAPNP